MTQNFMGKGCVWRRRQKWKEEDHEVDPQWKEEDHEVDPQDDHALQGGEAIPGMALILLKKRIYFSY